MAKLVFHVDVNSAYLSWEAAQRVANGEPDIRLIPAVIGGDREKRTGVVLAKSIPAKKFGIKTGEPIGMALRKCPDLFMAKPDFKLYEENSRKFMDICREYAPVVEKYSIDECFLDMSGTHRIYPDPVAIAHPIKVVIDNYPADKEEMISLPNHPQKPELGTREVPMTREIYIDADDFAEVPPPKFFRLKPDSEVRLMGGYIIKCGEIDPKTMESKLVKGLYFAGEVPTYLLKIFAYIKIPYNYDSIIRWMPTLKNKVDMAVANKVIGELLV